MNKYYIWMIIASAIPLLLIFIVPILGVNGGFSLFFIITLIFVFHLFVLFIISRGEEKHKR